MTNVDPLVPLPVVIALSSVLSVLAALLIAAAAERLRPPRDPLRGRAHRAVFLVADGAVVDSNEPGLALLAVLQAQHLPHGPERPAGAEGITGPAASWLRLQSHLAQRFPEATARLAATTGGSSGATWQLTASDGSGQTLEGEVADGVLRLTLGQAHPLAAGDGVVRLDPLAWQTLNEELEVLRRTTDASPVPAWREGADGRVVWANGAYLRLLAEAGQAEALAWPLPSLFAPERSVAGAGRSGRQCLTLGAQGQPRSFDLVQIDEAGARLVFALPADEAQRAERTKRDFVQTLSRTFATLPVGLAVFDLSRRLQLFNPALADLTGLEPEFLASRPGLEGVLNRMRDKHVMPEPRDYRAWTRRLLEVEAVACGAGFEEIWALPDGRTFRVGAAPHPDGALALLIEDVTSDIRLKRSFRAELDAGRAALDLVDEGVALFDAAGALLLTNAAFDRIWMLEGEESLLGMRFDEAVANWRDAGGEPAFWDRVAALTAPGSPGADVRGTMRLEDGEAFAVRARRAPGGGVMISFSAQGQSRDLARPARPEAQRLRRAIG